MGLPTEARKPTRLVLTLAALGVVFGDIGTSPLYAFSLVFSTENPHSITPTQTNIYGVISTIFWLVTLVVTVKYGSLILRADNKGEGGVVALYTLLKDIVTRHKILVVFLTFAGASLFLGDALITPAISLLSAVEGIAVVAPSLEKFIVPIVLTILAALFAFQRFGTKSIGKLFGPTMLVWFTVLGVLGVVNIAHHPQVFEALNPWYAFQFATNEPLVFFAGLSILLLTITGVEALYADLGHFGRKPIFMAWLWVAFPALILNYLGQASFLLTHPEQPHSSLLYAMSPSWFVTPLIVVATAATVIASQAVISGAFSLTAQASKLGILPRMRLRYPSGEHGQVYVSAVNWLLFFLILGIVAAFHSSEKLANAYGLSVVACMLVDTIMFFWFARLAWNRVPKWLTVTGFAVFAAIDVALLTSSLPKVTTGGWLPLAIAVFVCTLFWVWRNGRLFVTEERQHREGPLQLFIDRINATDTPRIDKTAVYLHPDDDTVPLSMRTVLERFHVVHEHALIVSVIVADQPHVAVEDSFELNDLNYSDDGIFHVELTFGFNDKPDVPKRLSYAAQARPELLAGDSLDDATYYVSRFDTGDTPLKGLPFGLTRVYKAMNRWSTDPIKYYNLPLERTVTMGAHLVPRDKLDTTA